MDKEEINNKQQDKKKKKQQKKKKYHLLPHRIYKDKSDRLYVILNGKKYFISKTDERPVLQKERQGRPSFGRSRYGYNRNLNQQQYLDKSYLAILHEIAKSMTNKLHNNVEKKKNKIIKNTEDWIKKVDKYDVILKDELNKPEEQQDINKLKLYELKKEQALQEIGKNEARIKLANTVLKNKRYDADNSQQIKKAMKDMKQPPKSTISQQQTESVNQLNKLKETIVSNSDRRSLQEGSISPISERQRAFDKVVKQTNQPQEKTFEQLVDDMFPSPTANQIINNNVDVIQKNMDNLKLIDQEENLLIMPQDIREETINQKNNNYEKSISKTYITDYVQSLQDRQNNLISPYQTSQSRQQISPSEQISFQPSSSIEWPLSQIFQKNQKEQMSLKDVQQSVKNSLNKPLTQMDLQENKLLQDLKQDKSFDNYQTNFILSKKIDTPQQIIINPDEPEEQKNLQQSIEKPTQSMEQTNIYEINPQQLNNYYRDLQKRLTLKTQLPTIRGSVGRPYAGETAEQYNIRNQQYQDKRAQNYNQKLAEKQQYASQTLHDLRIQDEKEQKEQEQLIQQASWLDSDEREDEYKGEGKDFDNEGTTLKQAIKDLKTNIVDIDDYDIQVVTNYEKDRIKPTQKYGTIVIFLRNHHYTVMLYHDYQVWYFDPLAMKKRRDQDFIPISKFILEQSPEFQLKAKFNTNKWQENDNIEKQLDRDTSAMCWQFCFTFLHHAINLGESYKKSTHFQKDDQNMIENFFPYI